MKIDYDYLDKFNLRLRLIAIPYNDGVGWTEINEWGYEDFGNALKDYCFLETYLDERESNGDWGWRLEIYDYSSQIHYKNKCYDYDGEVDLDLENITPFIDVLETWKNGDYGFEEMEIEYNKHPFSFSHYPPQSYNIK